MADDGAVSLGRAIMAARSARGVKRRELADLAAISYPYLAELEKGAKRGSTGVIERISTALGMSLSELIASAESIRVGEMPSYPQRLTSPLEQRSMRRSGPAAEYRPTSGEPSDKLQPLAPQGELDEELIVRSIAARVRSEVERWLELELEPAIRAELHRQRNAAAGAAEA
jgi:transcriptional regulator with XRE-family HTH domain